MKTRVRELVEIGDRLYSKRFPILTLWQTLAENFYPIRADFTRVRQISEEFASYLMTGRPVMAHRDLGNALSSMLRPRGQPWFYARTENETINNDPAARAWLDRACNIMRGIMYDRRSQFVRATKEGDNDFVAFGQCVIEVRPNDELDGLIYRTWHLRDTVWTENAHLVIDEVHRKWKLEARQLASLFPETVPESIVTLKEKEPAREIECRHIVVPSDDYDLPDRKTRKLPYVSVVIDAEHETILEEKPQRALNYVIPRWVTIGGFSQYAYSPATVVALPDARMLQQIGLTLLEAGQKVVDPPMIAVGDAINGGVNLYAGGITHVDADYDERTGEVLRPITLRPEGLQWGDAREARIEAAIKEAFYLNLITMPDVSGEKMTAYEVQKRFEEYLRRALPLFEPMETEYNGGLCDLSFDLAFHLGAFGSPYDMPPSLRGQNVRFQFVSPLQAAEDQAKSQSFVQATQLLAAAMQVDPNVRQDFNVDRAFRDALIGTAPADWIVPEREAEAAKAQVAKAQAAQAAAAQLGQVAEAGGKIGIAAKNVGDAAQSLKQVGLD